MGPSRSVTDDISIFPSYLFPPLYDHQLTLRPTKAEMEARGWETVMGIDIARSASVGADYFVIFTMAKDQQGQRFIVDINRTKGLPFNRQLELMAREAEKYNPGLVYIESNAMQQIYPDEMRRQTDIWQAEASQFGYIDGKLQGIGIHDDTVMAWWFAEEATKAGGFSFAFGDDDGTPGSFDDDEGEGDDYTDILLGDPKERGNDSALF